MDQDLKVQENRARRRLDRMGFSLMKSRRKDPRALEYGGYMIVNRFTNAIEAGGTPGAYALSIEDVERWIEEK
jgi:hypothetical protein